MTQGPGPLPFDYDRNPERFSLNERNRRYNTLGDVHDHVAELFREGGCRTVLDVGCGSGALQPFALAEGLAWTGLDLSGVYARRAPRPVVLGDATRLPFRDDSFDGVAGLYMLYHLPEPRLAVADAARVLRPGGLYVTCAPSRFTDPELAPFLPPEPEATFDAENGPDIIATAFAEVRVERWEDIDPPPLAHLPDREAVRSYLVGHLVEPGLAASVAERVDVPLVLTKRGAIIVGRKRLGGGTM